MKKIEGNTHYVDNEKFLNAIKEYRKQYKEYEDSGKNIPEPRISNYIGECLYKIAVGLVSTKRFVNYTPEYKQEMISDGIENCLLYFRSFVPETGVNPFAYFTQVIKNAFYRRIYKEKRSQYAMLKSFQHTVIFGNENGGPDIIDDDGKVLTTPKMHDNMNRLMSEFEELEKKKKDKRIEKKKGLMDHYDEN